MPRFVMRTTAPHSVEWTLTGFAVPSRLSAYTLALMIGLRLLPAPDHALAEEPPATTRAISPAGLTAPPTTPTTRPAVAVTAATTQAITTDTPLTTTSQPTPVRPPDVPTPTVVLQPGQVPKIVFDTPEYDFGRIPATDSVDHDYWFVNPGNGPLEILSVKPGCGCTVTGNFDRIVQPGDAGRIPIHVNVHSGGPLTKGITVYTNLPEEPSTVSLQIKGALWQPIDTTPNSVFFGRVNIDQANAPDQVRKVSIENNLEPPAKLTGLRSSNPAFKPELTTLEPGRKYELSVAIVPPVTKGSHAGNINMETGIEDFPVVQVPVNIYVSPEIEVNPDILELSKMSARITRQLFVQNYSGKPVKITELQSSNPALKTTLTDQGNNMSYRIDVEVPPDFEAGDKDQVTFKTDLPTLTQIAVPVVKMAPPSSQPAGAVAVGKPAPRVSIKATGSSRSSQGAAKDAAYTVQLGGPIDKPTVLIFYTTWCGYCRTALPEVEKIHQRYRDKGVRFIAISEDELNGMRAVKPADVTKHFEELKLTFDRASDWTKEISAPFSAGSFPTFYVIGKSGNLEMLHFGANEIESDLTGTLDRLLAEKRTEPTAPMPAG